MFKIKQTLPIKSIILIGLVLFFCQLNLPCFAMASRHNNPPKITAFSPKDRTTYISGDTLNISVIANDLDKDRLQYRYKIDKNVTQNWSSQASYSLKFQKKDLGRHNVTVDVKDNRGGTDIKSIDIFVFFAAPKPGN